MKRSTIGGFLVLSLLLASSAAGQSAYIHQQIQQTYDFQRHLLGNKEITEKSAALDQLWARAKAEPALYTPALRQEVGDFKNPVFFLYDGSMLLLSLSNTSVDRKITLAAMARCDLRDVQAKDYFVQVHRTATLNEDTTAAALHVLEQPKFTVIVYRAEKSQAATPRPATEWGWMISGTRI